MTTTMLTQHELADRWGIASRTLENWRQADKGPPFMKLEGTIRYRLADIEKYEQENMLNEGDDNGQE